MPQLPEWTSSDRGQQSLSQLQYPEAWEYFSSQKPTLDRALNTRQFLMDQGLSAEQANAIVGEFQMAMGKNPPYRQAAGQSLVDEIRALAPQMAQAAQEVYDNWEQDENGEDFELGTGGICDRVSDAISGVIVQTIPDILVMDGGQPGDEHAYPIAARDTTHEAVIVDIPYSAYESGGGYNWQKIPDVVFDPSFVEVTPIDWEYVAEAEEWQDYDSSVDDPQPGPDEFYSKARWAEVQPAVMEPGQIEDFDFENWTVNDQGWQGFVTMCPAAEEQMHKMFGPFHMIGPMGSTWEEAKAFLVKNMNNSAAESALMAAPPDEEFYYKMQFSDCWIDWTIRKIETDRNSKVAKDDPDPEYSFMYYKSAIEVVPWTHNVRYREIAQRLLNKFNTRLEDGGWKDDEGEWSGGDIYVQDDGLRVEFKHLANPEIQSSALQAIRHWYDNEMREKSNIDWEMEGEETRTGRTANEFNWFQAAQTAFDTELNMTGNYEQAIQVATQEAVKAGASPEQAQQTAQQIGDHYTQTVKPGSDVFDSQKFEQGIGQAAQQVFQEFKTNEPDWHPLEVYFRMHPERINDFMFMGYVSPGSPGDMLGGLRMYKNRETRRYLHLDSRGNQNYLSGYKNGQDTYTPIDLVESLVRVYDWILSDPDHPMEATNDPEAIFAFLKERDERIAQWHEDNPQ